MKKILLTLAIGLIGFASMAETISTNMVLTTGFASVLSSNRASIYSIELTAQYPAVVNLWDSDGNGNYFYFVTNYNHPAFPYRTSYTTNYVTSFIGYNGYTNYYTNAGLWTVTLTNAASTNAMPPIWSGVVAGGTYAVYNVDLLCARGIAATATTNCSVVINYRKGQ